MQSAVTSICILLIIDLGIIYGGSIKPRTLQLEKKDVGNRDRSMNFMYRLAFTTPFNKPIVANIPVTDERHSSKTINRAEEHKSKTEYNFCETEMQVLKIKELEQRLIEAEKLISRIDDFEKRLKEAERKTSNIEKLEQRLKESSIKAPILNQERKFILTKRAILKPMYPERRGIKPNRCTLRRLDEENRNFKNIVPNELKYNSIFINKTTMHISDREESEKVHDKMFKQNTSQDEIFINSNAAMTPFSTKNTPRDGITTFENDVFKIIESFDHVMNQKSIDHRANEYNGHTHGSEMGKVNERKKIVQKEYHGLIGKESRFARTKKSNVQDKLNVAFSAHMGGWDILKLANLETFTEISLNDGNAYDAHLTGIYFFTATIVSQGNKFQGAIVLNGDEVAYITTGEGPGYQQGSNSITIHCNQGQRVWIRVAGNFGVGKSDNRFSVFTGFLVHSLAESSSN